MAPWICEGGASEEEEGASEEEEEGASEEGASEPV